MKKDSSLRASVEVYTILFASLGLWLCLSSEAHARTWTRQNGDHFDAEVVRREGGNGGFVVLRKLSGAEVTIRIWNLSEEDQQYVKQCLPAAESAAKPQPPQAKANPEAPETGPKDADHTLSEQQARTGRRDRVRRPMELSSRVFILRLLSRR
jgi:hypothetical protein